MPMKKLRVPLRVVFYKDEPNWIAHCLEFDLMGDGATQKEAAERLSNAIAMQLEATLDYKNLENLFKPADAKYFLMFAAGKDTAKAELRMQIDSVTIDEAETRQYIESDVENEAGLAFA